MKTSIFYFCLFAYKKIEFHFMDVSHYKGYAVYTNILCIYYTYTIYILYILYIYIKYIIEQWGSTWETGNKENFFKNTNIDYYI